MRRATLILTLALAGCATEVVELVPDAGRAAISDAGASATDAGGVVDAAPPDLGVLDAGVVDADAPDLGVRDTGARDTGVADAGFADSGVVDAGAACVCRYATCQATFDCQMFIDQQSICDQNFRCTGQAQACQQTADCGREPGWLCAREGSFDRCP